ncbi:MAG TPA: LptF/LptG family permease, partial [Syntrophales bacterium]|nr:LptF/LptG family permease [Syntrophales bacterium]
EGQVVQVNRRSGAPTVFLVLRDPDVDMSLSLTIPATTLDAMPLPIRETPVDFEAVQKSPDKMGYFELKTYIDKLDEEGTDVNAYLTDLHAKLAFAFVTLILTAIGVIFSVHAERSGGVARSIGLGIVIGFSYWIVHAFSVSLGRSGTIAPLPAAWAANAVFVILALVLGRRIRT